MMIVLRQTFPDNEVRKGQLTMQLKRLRETQEGLVWAPDSNELPIISWDSCMSPWVIRRECVTHYFLDQEQSAKRPLVLIAGFIHDVSKFMDEHPGGRHLIAKMIGKDATTAFFGGVYDHSNAAHNLLSMMRVGILDGGHPHGLDDKSIPPGQRLRIAQYNEIGSGYGSAMSDGGEGLMG